MYQERWLEKLDEENFWQTMENWHRRLYVYGQKVQDLQEANKALQSIVENLSGSPRGDQKFIELNFPEMSVTSSQQGDKEEFKVILPNSLQNKTLLFYLLEYALGIKIPAKRIGAGTRSSGGLIKINRQKLAGVYMRELDITGIERLKHTELLRVHGCNVPESIIATTNFYLAEFIGGKIAYDKDMYFQLNQQMKEVRKKLIAEGSWDPSIRIEGVWHNYRLIRKGIFKKEVACIDPVLRNGKFIMG